MKYLSFDPGNEETAWVLYEPGGSGPGSLLGFGLEPNADIRSWLRGYNQTDRPDRLVIEMPKPRGMPTSYEEMLMCVWIGRFIEAWDGEYSYIHRLEEKLTVCGRANATDTNIRHALIDRYGPGKARAVGLKDTPGPLYGVTNDVWQALAVAVTFAIKNGLEAHCIEHKETA